MQQNRNVFIRVKRTKNKKMVLFGSEKIIKMLKLCEDKTA